MSDNNPVIGDEAVEAAAKLLWYSDSTLIDTERPDWADAVTNRVWAGLVEDTRNTAREILEAAAPYIIREAKAEAWDEGRAADDFEVSIGFDANPYRSQA